MTDPKQSARHRIDATKTLNALADPGPEAATARDIISIRIDLGSDIRAQGGTPSPADILVYEVTPNPNNTIDVTPEELPPPRRGPNKQTTDDGNGDNHL